MSSATVPVAPAAPSSAPAPAGRWSRWSDRLNPILVREVQQAVKGRVFATTVLAALAVTVAIAASVVSHYEPSGRAGRDAFHAGFATLMPLLLFVVPMQAYQSMRLELRSGIVEQLLLSKLRPMHILLGKLQAAMVQFVLYVAVLSPLLGTSYLLRGVDVPTIAVSVAFAAVGCLCATSFAVSSAAQAVLPGLQPIANLASAFGLGMAAFGFVGFIGSGEYSNAVGWLLRSDECWAVLSAMGLLALAACTLAMLAARSFLLHQFENKATPFRVFLFVLPPVAYGWMLLFVPPAEQAMAMQLLTCGLLLVGAVFGVFMVTEQRELSPRLRAHAPAGLAGVLAAPFLPGRDRGTACFTIYALALTLVGWLGWPRGSGSLFGMAEPVAEFALMALAYTFVYLGLGRWLRSRLPPTLQGNHLARFLLPVALFLFILVPVLIDVFAHGEMRSWHPGHLMNPFVTIDAFVLSSQRWDLAWPMLQIVLPVVVALQVPAIWRGVREVLVAGAARRRAQASDG